MKLKNLSLVVLALIGLFAAIFTVHAAQRDTNTTTSVTAYTPKAPGDVLIGGTVAAFDSQWIAGADTNGIATSNDWKRLLGPTNTFNAIAISGSAGAAKTNLAGTASLAIRVNGTNYFLKLYIDAAP